MPTARWWKKFYEDERAKMGPSAIDALFEEAPTIDLGDGALVFPHTRLSRSGWIMAAVARAIVRARCEKVLAIGVLHGAREADANLVERARAGDEASLRELRRVHTEEEHASEEFSLDAFRAVLARAAELERVTPPRVLARYPYLVGDRPDDLPGIDVLRRECEGAVVVATTDPVHHGIGYGTPPDRARSDSDPHTTDLARRWVGAQLAALERAQFSEFADLCDMHRSDFRDAGPTLAALVPNKSWTLHELVLVDYADILQTARPTWVAAGLIRVSAPPPS
jgi:hypothetical protein